jgi:endonuclease/exonuclease/phosphatase (EEP) superfamily protein YafD
MRVPAKGSFARHAPRRLPCALILDTYWPTTDAGQDVETLKHLNHAARCYAFPLMDRLTALYGAGLTAFLLARLLLRDTHSGLTALINSTLHLLMKPALLWFPLAVFRRRWPLAALLLPPAGAFFRAYGSLLMRGRWNRRAQRTLRAPGPPILTILTYNIHAERRYLKPMILVIRKSGADIVALQELSFPAARLLAAEFVREYPYQALHPNGSASAGQGIMSRFPLQDDDYWQHVDIPGALGHQRVTVEVHGQRFAFYNLHPVHPGMVGGLFDARPRAIEIERLLARISRETFPVILAGDFNMSDQADDYRRITALYRDAFREGGRGMGYTFPDWRAPQSRSVINGLPLGFMPRLVRLDYVFHNDTLQVLDARVWPTAGGSDHRPLRVRLAVANQSGADQRTTAPAG